MRIVIEALEPMTSGSLFRLLLNEKQIGDNLTAVQTHLLLGKALEMFALPGRSKRRPAVLPADLALSAVLETEPA